MARPRLEPPPEARDDLRAYLDWLADVWLPSLTGQRPEPKRPTLTLVKGGRDDG